jgi:hypothetical protein
MIRNSESFGNPNVKKELEWKLFNDWFVKAFWEFKKVNRLTPNPIHSKLSTIDIFKHLAPYKFEQFNNCMYLIIQASHHFCEFNGVSDSLNYKSIFKLFEDMHQEDPTNELFYRHIFHHKNLRDYAMPK